MDVGVRHGEVPDRGFAGGGACFDSGGDEGWGVRGVLVDGEGGVAAVDPAVELDGGEVLIAEVAEADPAVGFEASDHAALVEIVLGGGEVAVVEEAGALAAGAERDFGGAELRGEAIGTEVGGGDVETEDPVLGGAPLTGRFGEFEFAGGAACGEGFALLGEREDPVDHEGGLGWGMLRMRGHGELAPRAFAAGNDLGGEAGACGWVGGVAAGDLGVGRAGGFVSGLVATEAGGGAHEG